MVYAWFTHGLCKFSQVYACKPKAVCASLHRFTLVRPRRVTARPSSPPPPPSRNNPGRSCSGPGRTGPSSPQPPPSRCIPGRSRSGPDRPGRSAVAAQFGPEPPGPRPVRPGLDRLARPSVADIKICDEMRDCKQSSGQQAYATGVGRALPKLLRLRLRFHAMALDMHAPATGRPARGPRGPPRRGTGRPARGGTCVPARRDTGGTGRPPRGGACRPARGGTAWDTRSVFNMTSATQKGVATGCRARQRHGSSGPIPLSRPRAGTRAQARPEARGR